MRVFQHVEAQTEIQSPINKQKVKDTGKAGRNREAQHEARGKIRTWQGTKEMGRCMEWRRIQEWGGGGMLRWLRGWWKVGTGLWMGGVRVSLGSQVAKRESQRISGGYLEKGGDVVWDKSAGLGDGGWFEQIVTIKQKCQSLSCSSFFNERVCSNFLGFMLL